MISQFSRMSIRKKRIEKSQRGIEKHDGDSDDVEVKKPQIFIDQIISMELEDKYIIHNVATMITAAHDTSSTALANALLLLGMHQDVQQKLYEELVQVFYGEEIITFDTVKELTYMDMVVCEVLRIAGPVGFISRQNLRNVEIDGIEIPKGNIIIMNLYNLHRRKDIWGPNADKFDPDNFLPERIDARPAYVFIPFISGPRACIGKKILKNNL